MIATQGIDLLQYNRLLNFLRERNDGCFFFFLTTDMLQEKGKGEESAFPTFERTLSILYMSSWIPDRK